MYRGGSLELWQHLFPQGLVVGVDKNATACWPPLTVRIVADQTEPQLPGILREHAPQGYDLIVDDASHDGVATRRTWELLWPLVRPGCWYVIEDWQVGFDGVGWDIFDGSMVELAAWFLGLLSRPGGEVEEITYRFGMIILRKWADGAS